MIAFASIFLGLVLGVRPVEMVVSGPVAAVELRLDGRAVGRVREEPWTLECDFGSELAPRLLEAVAFDDGGGEVGRAVQWLNLPQPRAAANVLLEPRRPGEPRIARLSWESAAGAVPESVTASVDGEPLAIDDPRRLVLPRVDESQLHLLSVELEFEGEVASRVDLTFGGTYAEEVSTEITALAIWERGRPSKKKQAPLTAEEVRGWFLKHGEPLEVIAVDRELAEVVVVMGRPFPRFHEPGERYKAPKSLSLDDGHRLRFLSPRPEASQGVATTFRLFPISPSYEAGGEDLYTMLTRLVRPSQDEASRIVAAVAVAGLAAYEGRHRRAVVLLPSPRPEEDGEDLTPARVRRYLSRLRVPLYVWDPGTRPDPSLDVWGDVRAVGSLRELAAAFAELEADLDRQWIVWLDGRHLPQDIELAAGVEGYSLTP